MKNIKVEYIYSADEKPTNEISENSINAVKMLARQVINYDPEFIL